ncbi:MAG: NAD-dependent epimerase/dehydratase family protein [Vicinamibacterales bacterium]
MTATYAGQRVLVIGGLGYLGSNLTAALLDAGADVTVVTPARARHILAAARMEARGARVVDADIRDRTAMRDAVRGQAIVFNVSGQSGALRSVQDPASDLDVNGAGNLSLLEALRLDGSAAKLVFAGSRLVYGAARMLPVSEDQPIAPLCPHGVHKAMVEHYLAIYGRLHGLRATCLRITNPYGPGQPSDRSAYGVINYLIHRAVAGQSLPIFGDGAQVRDYVFVDDVIHAMLLAGGDARSDGRVYNIGSGVGTSMIDAARLIVRAVGEGRVELEPWPPLVHEIDTGDFVADISRAGAELGWQPTVALADGLRRTVASISAEVAGRS